METIKIIDLLNKIANDEAPKKIKQGCEYYEFLEENNDYLQKGSESYCLFSSKYDIALACRLNDEVEIIEENKEIEKLDVTLLEEGNNWLINPKTQCIKNIKLNSCFIDIINSNILEIQYKINELIDKVNSLEKRGD